MSLQAVQAPIALDPSQERAVDLMCTARIGVVTGGPGTGKTTVTRTALERLEARGVSVALAAPTGKAARRMEEATGRDAGTIHRLLGWTAEGFTYNKEYPLLVDAVFVDEASMIDTELADDLMSAIQGKTRLILIGDKDQLPSVGAGSVFADIIGSDAVPVARLSTLHRAAAGSWVATQAPRILAGEMPDLSERDDFRWFDCEARDDAVVAAIIAAVGDGQSRPIQVLAAQNVGPAGTAVINAKIKAKTNPGNCPPLKLGRTKAHVGDRVIQTRNDYKLEVMNGEIGTIAVASGRTIAVRFDDGRRVDYSPEKAAKLQLAYALTVHKSQGSEFPWVVVFCHSTHTQMLTRKLLYTAITRAKAGVILVGDKKGLRGAIRNTKDGKRKTGLVGRIREGTAA